MTSMKREELRQAVLAKRSREGWKPVEKPMKPWEPILGHAVRKMADWDYRILQYVHAEGWATRFEISLHFGNYGYRIIRRLANFELLEVTKEGEITLTDFGREMLVKRPAVATRPGR